MSTIIKHLSQDQIKLVPESNWYSYTLECNHTVYTKIRISCRHSYNEHFIRCPKCQSVHTFKTNWQPVLEMKAVSDETANAIKDGFAFVQGERILRTDGTAKSGAIIPAGNPFPYRPGVHE
jgi:hypothetical protein